MELFFVSMVTKGSLVLATMCWCGNQVQIGFCWQYWTSSWCALRRPVSFSCEENLFWAAGYRQDAGLSILTFWVVSSVGSWLHVRICRVSSVAPSRWLLVEAFPLVILQNTAEHIACCSVETANTCSRDRDVHHRQTDTFESVPRELCATLPKMREMTSWDWGTQRVEWLWFRFPAPWTLSISTWNKWYCGQPAQVETLLLTRKMGKLWNEYKLAARRSETFFAPVTGSAQQCSCGFVSFFLQKAVRDLHVG